MVESNGFGTCPQCSGRMYIEVLACWRCGTTVNGRLGLPLLARLPGELSGFATKFLLADGSLAQVQKVLGCSYPKARRLLDETIAAVRAEIEADARERDQILKALEEDRLEGKQAVRLIRGLLASGER